MHQTEKCYKQVAVELLNHFIAISFMRRAASARTTTYGAQDKHMIKKRLNTGLCFKND